MQQTVVSSVIDQNSLVFIPQKNWKYHLVALVIQKRLKQIRASEDGKFLTLVTGSRDSALHWMNFILENFRGSVSVNIFTVGGQRGPGGLNTLNSSPHFTAQDVVIGVSDIMRDAIVSGFLPISGVDTVIIDECQLAIGSDPTASLCEYIRDLPASEYRPLVLGVTSSPVNCKKVSNIVRLGLH